jgi:protein-S-isoprenylcysteine O-methyltransferase Ste14
MEWPTRWAGTASEAEMTEIRKKERLARIGSLAVLGLAAAEVIIMISPFAGLFYATTAFGGLLGFFSRSPPTAWLDGFFLNHSVVTTSALLEWQREIGFYLLILGLVGFFVSAARVYGGKVRHRGVAKESLYRYVRHPQYLCLGIAGWGLLTSWPRLLLLGVWVTMLFLYAGLARFEERRMEESFGEEYRRFAAERGAFLPGSPVRRLFEASFGRLRPRAVGWAISYMACLAAAFALGLGLRSYTRAASAVLIQPEHQTVIISVWPQPAEWMARVVGTAYADDKVRHRLAEEQGGDPVVATILPARYGMRDMYYKRASQRQAKGLHTASLGLPMVNRLYMGVDPATSDAPVEVVFSRAEKAYKDKLPLDEVFDAGVRLIPLVVVEVDHGVGQVVGVHLPLPQNFWGPDVVMPIL